ncbi:MAG: hypothetical protein JXB88_06055 [Spirochaetales bacterium]|nr:hypothetical protein [Spirochaetales bacterium]
MDNTILQNTHKHTLWIHRIIILFGLFLCIQDLIAENLKNIGFLYQLVKYADEAVSFLFFFILVINHLYKKQSIKKTEIDLPLIFFLLIGIISSIIHKVPMVIASSQFIIYVKSFLFFYIFIYLPVTTEIIKLYIRVFFWAGCILFFFGLVDLVIPVQFRQFTGNTIALDIKFNITSIKSFFSHPAVFGWFMNFLALYFFAFFLVYKRWTFLCFCLIFLAGCLLAMKVKAIIGFVVSFWLGFFIYPFKKGKQTVFVVLFIVMTIILIFTGSMLFELIGTKYTMYFNIETYADAARNVLYLKSIDIARDAFPLGVGFGRYGSWMSHEYYSPVYHQYGLSQIWGLSKAFPNFIVDTFWPMIIGETGFIGFTLYLTLFFIMFRVLYKNIRKRKNPLVQSFCLGTFMIFIESLFESIAAPVYVAPPFSFFIFGALGLAFALRRVSD